MASNKRQLLNQAITFAWNSHFDQVDKNGEPYFLHLTRVMANVGSELEYMHDNYKIIAILHDIVEETDVTLAMVRTSFGPAIANSVDALTRRKGEYLTEYLTRLVKDDYAIIVKRADVEDNTDEGRVGQLDTEVAKRLREKYTITKMFLDKYDY